MNRFFLFLLLIAFFFTFNSCSTAPESLNIMSYNIRLDVNTDGANQWHNRRDGIVSLIQEVKPDVFGIQEGLPHQVAYLSNQLEEYSMIGEGRDGGDNGEYSAVFYKNKKLKLLKAETFWLSETPQKPSIGWDAALNRIATVGVFTSVKSDKKIVVYNSHFDHLGKVARTKSAQLIINHIQENNYSENGLVVMGDFNSLPTDAPIKLLSNNLKDAFNVFPVKNPEGTFNGFDLNSKLSKRIDYIFTKNIEVVEFRHIHKKLSNGLWPSDHLPVFISTKK